MLVKATLTFILLFNLVSANAYVRTGTMFVSLQQGKETRNQIKDLYIVAENRYLTFEYMMGTIRSLETGKYLSFNEVGWSVLDKHPYPGFFLRKIPHTGRRFEVMFNGNKVFQFCPDKSIGYKSQCEGAKGITIVFEETAS